MNPSDIEITTALMALRAIAYQAETHLSVLSKVMSAEDSLDRADVVYTQECLDRLVPAIQWLEDRIAETKGLPSD